MTDSDARHYTVICLVIGLVFSAVLWLMFFPVFDGIMGIYFRLLKVRNASEPGANFSVVRAATLIGSIGLVLLWLSSRLDFVEKSNDTARWPLLGGVGYIVLGWVTMACLNAAARGVSLHPGETSASDFFFGLLGLVAIIPYAVIFRWSFLFVCFGFFVGGLLCVPRAIVFLTTSHRTRPVFERGRAAGLFDAPSVVGSLGKASRSKDHARALRKDALALQKDVDARAAELESESARLSKAINDDTERLRTESAIAVKMAKIEELQIQIDEMKRFSGGKP